MLYIVFMENYMYSGYMHCSKCDNPQIEKWIDGVCSGCRPEAPTSEQMLAISFQKLNSMNNQLTFYTVLVVINLIGILLLIFGVIEI